MPRPADPRHRRVHRLPFQRRPVNPSPEPQSHDQSGPISRNPLFSAHYTPFAADNPFFPPASHRTRHPCRPFGAPAFSISIPLIPILHDPGPAIPILPNPIPRPSGPVPGNPNPVPFSPIPHNTAPAPSGHHLPGPNGRNSSRNPAGRCRMPVHHYTPRHQQHPRDQPPDKDCHPSAPARRNSLPDTRPNGLRWNEFQVMHFSLHLMFKFWVVHSSFLFFLQSRIY